jgi:hypothetical protein
VFKRAKAVYALDRAATGIGSYGGRIEEYAEQKKVHDLYEHFVLLRL